MFAGGATIEAAETITGADLDTLDRLVAKSLLVRRRQAHAPTRLAMLETIRAYAASASRPPPTAKPSASATTAISSRWPSATGPNSRSGGGRQGAPARLDAEIDNLEPPLRWAVGRPTLDRRWRWSRRWARIGDLRERYAAARSTGSTGR